MENRINREDVYNAIYSKLEWNQNECTCWYHQFHHLHDDIVNHIILFAYGYEIRKHDLKNNEIPT